jgi:hypothetical protein
MFVDTGEKILKKKSKLIGRYSSVGIATGYALEGRGSIPDRGNFSLFNSF